MHPENVKVLTHPMIGSVQLQRHPHIGTVLNDLQQIAISSPHQLQIGSAPLNEFSSFYISFRLASILPSTHSWGVHIAQADIRSLEQKLVVNGCSQADSQRIAKETIYSMLAFQFLLDCELLNLHEIFFVAGYGPQPDFALDAVLGESRTTGIIGMSFAGENLRSEFGFTSAQSAAIELNLPCYYKRGEFAAFSREVYESMLTNKISFSSAYARNQFVKTIPVYTNPERAFPGVSLPVNHF